MEYDDHSLPDDIKIGAERALFKRFVEESGEGMGWSGLDGTILYLNSALCRMLDIESPEDVYGKPVVTFYNQETGERLTNEIFKTVLKNGSWFGELEIVSSKGRRVPTNNSLFVLRDAADKPVGFANVVTDLTERRRANKELRESEQKYRLLVDNLTHPLTVYERDGKILLMNRAGARNFGLTPDDIVGKMLSEFFGPQSELMVARAHEVIDSGAGMEVEDEIALPEGRGWFYSNIQPMRDAAGRIFAVQTISYDITERKRAEEMMIQSEKMLSVGGLAAGMAHEINNPLASILQNLQVVRNRLTLGLERNIADARECGVTIEAVEAYARKRDILSMTEAAIDSGKRAARIVENMLSFSRKQEDSTSSKDLADLLDKTVDLMTGDYDLARKYDFRNIEINREYSDTPLVCCDGSKIQQVFLNLLKNGAEAMYDAKTEKPVLFLRVMRDGQTARVEIEDIGPGMPDDVRRRVFEPFYTTKDVGLGTGLGLSVSYFIIAENHGGTMAVESAPGRGTRFVIRLPLGKKTPL